MMNYIIARLHAAEGFCVEISRIAVVIQDEASQIPFKAKGLCGLYIGIQRHCN